MMRTSVPKTSNVRLLLILISAIVLTILPLPVLISPFRPPFILLFILYVQFFVPQYFNVTWVLFLGLCLDVLMFTVIGEHALILLLTSWVASGKTRRFNFFSTIQQMFLVLLFCLFYQMLLALINASFGYSKEIWSVCITAIVGMFLWPWIRWLADRGQHEF